MRKTIYLAIVERLKASGLGIEHFSLWNNNTEQLASSTAFRTPAVFVEFEPIEWRRLSMGVYDANGCIRLHVVSKTMGTPEDGSRYQEQALAHLDLADGINAAVQGFGGEGFNSLTRTATIPDHDHEGQLLHEVLIYTTHIVDDSAAQTYNSVQPAPAIAATIEKSRRP